VEKSIQLFLHSSEEISSLHNAYQRALSSATELLIVSAYLTNWDSSVALNAGCERFRMIVGKDFGITRKSACEAVLKWAPAKHKVHFRVAYQIDGFHPKAVFWREADGQAYAIIGSSNLSLAAFEKNYEANISDERNIG
jgi:HKD family nuclease